MPSNDDADAKQRTTLLQSTGASWPGCPLQGWVPQDHRLSKQPVEKWPIALLRLIEELAKISPSQNMSNQTRRRMCMVIKELYPVSNTLEDAIRDAKDKFMSLWPTKKPSGIPISQCYPSPDAIEDFGALDQPDVEAQSVADKAVLQAYQNAINNCGAAFGDRSAGPTISTHLTVHRRRDWSNPARVAGELWQSPELPVKSGYGDITEKVKDITAIEAHFQMPLSQFWKIEKLRPEEAYFIPAAVLRGIVCITEKFPTVKHDELYKLMVQEKAESRKLCRNANSKMWLNITQANIFKVLAKLQQLYDKTTSQTQTLDNGATSQGFDKRNRSLSPKLSSRKARKLPHTASTGHATGLNSSTGQFQSSAARQEAKKKEKELRREEREGEEKMKELEDRIKEDQEKLKKLQDRQKEIKEELKGLKGANE
ncbi:hypothetical protein DBV05_g11326 [Lasiodiplodia theobromae]|uniref:Uncharacterized protein n=1 Tax=Lasiodiplodia theobromae TaxID=45133 RepID=A0A5N5CXK4_9PEZI|nr:hypothetical protein DBV05_g11326 [Lasiodiplodia theobromae]